MKKIIISIYLSIGFIYALYGTFFDDIYKYKGFAYNLGRGIVWPACVFPVIGKAIGALIIILFFLYCAFDDKFIRNDKYRK